MSELSMADSGARIVPGTRLNGIFEVEELIAAGGMGEVYKGHNIQTGDAVAIKVMLPDFTEQQMAMALFRKEASALHNLQHEAIVRYYIFTVEPVLQRPYLAMEFVEGQPLSELLKHGPLTFEAVRALQQRLAAGLQAAHSCGIIHRDVSPDNVIVPNADVSRAKIIDFGIARSTRGGDGTVIGSAFAGKENYVSPEQAGLFGGDVTGKSDIYSLGLLLVEALTGRPIDMGGSYAEIIEKRQRVPDLGAVDLRIRPMIEQMLQPAPQDRPESMAVIATWPHETAPPVGGRSEARKSRDTGPAAAPRPTKRRLGLRLAATGALGLLVVGGGLAAYQFYFKAPTLLTDPDQITRFVIDFDGGDCFYATPVQVGANAAIIVGLGASVAPFQQLDSAFTRAVGFEPNIGVKQVTAAQCPALSFLGRLRPGLANAPRITVEGGTNVQSGQPLRGAVENFGTRHIDLLLVTDDGFVQNITYLLKPAAEEKSFVLRLGRSDRESGPLPQLLIAVASSKPLLALSPHRPAKAEELFSLALDEANRSGQQPGAAAAYFKLDR